ncbi:MAG TPA: ABC transporter permease, partial [Vicinamibacterales bacterium]|nr:ABC transporter permease [Vicinamibacterales bacterium]
MQDFRLAIRSLRATPVVTSVAILSLALGIGANIAIFSIVNSLLLRSLPVRDPQSLVLITDSGTGRRGWSYQVWTEIRRRPELFDGMLAFTPFGEPMPVAMKGDTARATVAWTSGSFFQTLGVRAWLGRTTSEDDDRTASGSVGPVAIVSYSFWQRQFGGTSDAIGRSLTVNGVPVTIVGVTPPDFFGTEVGRAVDVLLPIADEPLVKGRDSGLQSGQMNFEVWGRLRPG